MLKKLGSALVTISILLLAGAAGAVSFNSLGWVNPNQGESWSETALSGTARYTFDILDRTITSPSGKSLPLVVNTVEISFEKDIFAGLGSIRTVTPGWSLYSATSTDTAHWLTFRASDPNAFASASTPSLTVDVGYTLLSADRYRFDWGMENGKIWIWNEAQPNLYQSPQTEPWAQEYILSYSTLMSYSPWDEPGLAKWWTSGGSTAPVPEPGTLLLLGSGLAGLAWRRRKKN